MIGWLRDTWLWWVDLFSRKEDPIPLALVRIAISAVVLFDLTLVAWYGLPTLLWAPLDAGGTYDVLAMKQVPEVYRFLDPAQANLWGPTIAWSLWGGSVVSLLLFGAGIATRFSGLAFILIYAQTAIINDQADRGIDRMLRIVILLLLFSGAGKTLSVDAWIKTRRFLDPTPRLAWPRYLIIAQMVLMYWCAGIEKFAISWFPWGGYSALYIILQDPTFGVVDFSFLGSPWLYWTTQVGTAVSHVWEWTVPVLLLAYYYRATRARPGRVRALFNGIDVRMVYVMIGIVFHVALGLTMRLGIFPAAMLAFYPVFFHPDEIRAVGRRLGGLVRRRSAPEAHLEPG